MMNKAFPSSNKSSSLIRFVVITGAFVTLVLADSLQKYIFTIANVNKSEYPYVPTNSIKIGIMWYKVKYIREYLHAINNSWLHLNENVPEACINRMINYTVHVHGGILLDIFAHAGNLNALKYFYSTYMNTKYTYKLLDTTAANGHIECVKWIFNTFILMYSDGWYTYGAIEHAAKNGHLAIVQWLYESFKTADKLGQLRVNNRFAVDYINYSSIHGAAQGGHLQIMEWLHKNTPYKYSVNEMYYAAEYGHLHVIKYLQAQGFEYNASVFRLAAGNGRLNVIEYMYTQDSMGYTTEMLTGAIYNGHLPAVKWLCEHGVECNEYTLQYAVSDGNLELCEYVYALVLPSLHQLKELLMGALHNNNIQIAKWLYNTREIPISFSLEPHTSTTLRTLGHHSELNDIKWVLSILSQVGAKEYHYILQGAVHGKKYDTAKYMIDFLCSC